MNVGGALCNQILALWVIGACANMGHAADSNKLLEVPRDELRAVVGNDPRASFRVLFLRHLENDLDIGFFHLLANIPVNDRPTVAVQDRGDEVKRTADVQIGDIDMPVRMGTYGLVKPGSFLRRFRGKRVSSRLCPAPQHRYCDPPDGQPKTYRANRY